MDKAIDHQHYNFEMDGDNVRKGSFIFFCSIIGLAIFGLVSQLATNPLQFLLSIGKTLGVAVLLFAAIYFLFFRSHQRGKSSNKYKQAVKQSKHKYGNTQIKVRNTHSPAPSKVKTRKRATHLRVIEGNKPKKNNRASY